MANKFVGTGMLWGFPGGPSYSLTGFSVLTQLQSLDFSQKATKEQIKDGTGNTAAVAYSDHEDSATLDFIVTDGSTTASGGLTVTAMPAVGATLAVTDTNFTPISKTFLLDEVQVTRANNKAMMAKFTLSRYANNSLPS